MFTLIALALFLGCLGAGYAMQHYTMRLLTWVQDQPKLAPLGDTWVGLIPVVRDYLPTPDPYVSTCVDCGHPWHHSDCLDACDACIGEYTTPPNAVPLPVVCTCGTQAPVRGSAVLAYTCADCTRRGMTRTAYVPRRRLQVG